MTKFETRDKMRTNVVELSDQELMEMEGGLAPIVVGGVVIGWKLVTGIAATMELA